MKSEGLVSQKVKIVGYYFVVSTDRTLGSLDTQIKLDEYTKSANNSRDQSISPSISLYS